MADQSGFYDKKKKWQVAPFDINLIELGHLIAVVNLAR
jgi:hypothetical protein